MSVLVSVASGNFTTSTTWGLVDSTSYLNAENATESLLTTAYSGTRSSAFTPGAITVSHLGVKLCERIGTTGTMSVSLRDATIGLDDFVAGTEVTIDVADLPTASEANFNGGWIFFKLATPVLLSVATNYNIQAKTSSASQVDLWCDGTADNISRAIVVTTNQSPVAGDDLIIAEEKTGQGTANAFTVTMDSQDHTDYGAASTSSVTPGLAICDGGTLTWATTAATNFYLKLSGILIIYSGGTMNMGTVATPCPRNSSMTLTFDCGTNVDFGLVVRADATFVAQGLSRTAAKLIVSCKLNTDEAAAQTVLGVDTDTGWLSGDEISIASTTRTASQCETRVLNANANASDMEVTVGLTNAHSGTSPTQAEVILLTRNVKIQGASATLQGYIDIRSTPTVDIDWVEFKWLGSATANKRGFGSVLTTGSLSIQYSSLHDFSVASSIGFDTTASTSTGWVFSNNVTWNIANLHFQVAATSGTWTADSNIFMRNTDSSNLVSLSDVGGTFTNNTIVGSTSVGLALTESNATLGTFSTITCHSNASNGFANTSQSGTVTTLKSWRNNSAGIAFSSSGVDGLVFSTVSLFGNNTNNIVFNSTVGPIYFYSLTSNGDSTFSTTNGVVVNTTPTTTGEVYFYSSDFSTASGILTAHTNDISFNANRTWSRMFLNNTILAGTNEVVTQTNLGLNAFVGSQKHDQTAGSHKTWKKYGTLTIETTTVHSPGTESIKMTPNNASNKLESSGASGGFKVQVANGQTCTPTIYVYEDATYNGARSRLIVRRNDALGITADTVLDTATAASDEAWEALTGATAAVTDNGTLEFIIDCDGTAGNLFVGSASAVVA